MHNIRQPDAKRSVEDPTFSVFQGRTVPSLLLTLLVYKCCSYQWLARVTPAILTFANAIFLGRPVYWLIKKTIYAQFCGGESLSEVRNIQKQLESRNINVMLDYAAEPEQSPTTKNVPACLSTFFEEVQQNVFYAIDTAHGQLNPIVAIKMSGLFDNEVLKKLSKAMSSGLKLASDEPCLKSMLFNEGWQRLLKICEYARLRSVKIAIDAEQSFIQDAVDYLALKVMIEFNAVSKSEAPLIINTYQMYRKDGALRLKFLLEQSANSGFHVGLKLVRGAYLTGEKQWSSERNMDPITFDCIAETHQQYDGAVESMFSYVDSMPALDHRKFFMILATHNAKSIDRAKVHVKLLRRKDRLSLGFAQLYGMSDQITFSLGREGFMAYKYLPFGPVRDVIPYLIRRSQENAEVFKLANSDATLVYKEVARRFGFSS